jgi:hypothetical protein
MAGRRDNKKPSFSPIIACVCVFFSLFSYVHDASMVDSYGMFQLPWHLRSRVGTGQGQGNYLGWWNLEPAGVEGTERTLHRRCSWASSYFVNARCICQIWRMKEAQPGARDDQQASLTTIR